MSGDDIKEKRKFRRINANLIIDYTILSKDEIRDYQNMHHGMTENISMGGICFQVLEDIPPDTMIRLILAPPKLHTRLHVLAKTVWAGRIKDSKMYKVGASFLGLSEEDVKEIESLLIEENNLDTKEDT